MSANQKHIQICVCQTYHIEIFVSYQCTLHAFCLRTWSGRRWHYSCVRQLPRQTFNTWRHEVENQSEAGPTNQPKVWELQMRLIDQHAVLQI